MRQKCVVVIPIYKALDEDEIMVVRQAIAMTPNFKSVFVVPESFVLSDSCFKEFKDLEVVRFKDGYFADIQGYNRLMLSKEFYETFIEYEYLLIHQTDAYLFKEELEYWCNQGYDYIGAPWTFKHRQSRYFWFKFTFNYCQSFLNREDLVRRRTYNNVGNGGLSLRKISTFIDVLSTVKEELLEMYLETESVYYNEDVFWSIEASTFYKKFKKPTQSQAMYFALENESERLYNKMGKKLPFGCHDFKSLQPDFWKQFIPFKLPSTKNK